MIRLTVWISAAIGMLLVGPGALEAQTKNAGNSASKEPVKEQPFDAALKKYLAEQSAALERELLPGVRNRADFEKIRPTLRQEYLYMLGLDPMPERTPLNAMVTGKLEHKGIAIEKLYFQSSPGLYVTGNLYLPRERTGPAPAILYVCGHYSNMKREGAKAASDCQSHALWFASHGYVVLVIDTLELGEIAAMHRGTLRHERWWWHSAGYNPAGVECWNGMRAIDYLVSRPEVDPKRIGITGISGGGAVSFWVAAADERVAAAAPVSGMGDALFYAGETGVRTHCDCIMFYNTFRWNWGLIPALIAPRPLLFVNSDNDVYFPMAPNERLTLLLVRLYSRFGAGDAVESILSMGGHGYRTDIRRAVYGFFNRYLKSDARPVDDADTWVTARNAFPISPEKLRVFPADAELPKDQVNTRIDETFVAKGKPGTPTKDTFETWRRDLLERLKKVTFAAWPTEAPADSVPQLGNQPLEGRESTEKGIDVVWSWRPGKNLEAAPLLVLLNPGDEPGKVPAWAQKLVGDGSVLLLCTRGIGPVAWTKDIFPNTFERAFPILGSTSDSGRVWDVATIVRRHSAGQRGWRIAGEGKGGLIGAYAALFEPAITEVIAVNPPASHQPRKPGEPYGPALLNVLRVWDVPDALGSLAPRRLQLRGAADPAFQRATELYQIAGAADRIEIKNEN